MLSYLHSAGLRDTYDALKRETDNEDFTTDDPKAKWVGLLEKKWTSVIRLQKKVRVSLGLETSGSASSRFEASRAAVQTSTARRSALLVVITKFHASL